MNVDFHSGYEFFQKSAGGIIGAFNGAASGTARAEYIGSVEEQITELEDSINSFYGYHTSAAQLKGDIAEYWHAGTFNVNAATNDSLHRAVVDRSNQFGSVDVSSNFGDNFGLKYYGNAESSAKAQAASVFNRFKEYQSHGGSDSLNKYLADRQYTSDAVLNDPVYSGQIRVIPRDQMLEAEAWLRRMINTESVRRPEQMKRYQDTLDLLRDRIADSDGNESIPLSREDAQKLAVLAKEGKFSSEDFGITAPDMLTLDIVVKESLKAGLSATVISLVLKVGPEIYKAIDYLIKNGEIEQEQLSSVGFTALSGSAEGFVRGSFAAAIMTCCKSGALGEAFKEVSPGVVGTIVAVTMNTMKNSYLVAIGKKSRTEMSNELIRDLFVSSASLITGYVGQVILHSLPVVGYLCGSFVGSVIGSFAYNVGYKTAMSFCIETGVTMFGLVDQNYSLPEDVIADIGIDTFKYDTFSPEAIVPDTFGFDTFAAETFQADSIGIKYLRRGVIGVTKIGYIE